MGINSATPHKEESEDGAEMAQRWTPPYYQLKTSSNSSSFIMNVRLCGAIGSL